MNTLTRLGEYTRPRSDRPIGKWSSIAVASLFLFLIILLVVADDGYLAGSGVALSVVGLWWLYRVRCGSVQNDKTAH